MERSKRLYSGSLVLMGMRQAIRAPFGAGWTARSSNESVPSILPFISGKSPCELGGEPLFQVTYRAVKQMETPQF